MSKFTESLQIGHVAETKIAKWLISKGHKVLPAYQIVDNKDGGPKFFCKEGNFVTPDMLVFCGNGMVWIEAKHKTAFTWHRKTQRFVTGIDIHHWNDYIKVKELSGLPCWLLFNHIGGVAKDSPPSPSGLFTGEIDYVKQNINHTHDNWGRHGMVYWSMETLKKISEALN